jgi:hypothetical protein
MDFPAECQSTQTLATHRGYFIMKNFFSAVLSEAVRRLFAGGGRAAARGIILFSSVGRPEIPAN